MVMVVGTESVLRFTDVEEELMSLGRKQKKETSARQGFLELPSHLSLEQCRALGPKDVPADGVSWSRRHILAGIRALRGA